MFLEKADLFIRCANVSGCLKIVSNEEGYARVRKAVKVLESEFGLPVSYNSEATAQISENLNGPCHDCVTIDGIRVYKIFEFLIAAWEMGVKEEDVPKLASELADRLRSVGLKTIVQC